MRTYNWGILGPGHIAHKFTGGLKKLKNANLYSVVSRSMERAEKFAGEYGFSRAYDSYEEFVKDPDLDVVYIASPHSHHHEHTILCLENGKHVICEKAFAFNSRQVGEMIRTARENNVFLMEALWPPFQPSYEKAHQLIVEGKTGRPAYIISKFAFNGPYDPANRLFNPDLAGGSLLDIGIYPVMDALSFIGRPDIIKTNAVMAETGVDSSISVIFGYNDGRGASLYSSFTNFAGVATDIFCDKANMFLWRTKDGKQFLKVDYYDGKTENYSYKPPAGGFHFEAAAVMECLDMNLLESRLVPHEFSKLLIETLDRIRMDAGIVYAADRLKDTP